MAGVSVLIKVNSIVDEIHKIRCELESNPTPELKSQCKKLFRKLRYWESKIE